MIWPKLFCRLILFVQYFLPMPESEHASTAAVQKLQIETENFKFLPQAHN